MRLQGSQLIDSEASRTHTAAVERKGPSERQLPAGTFAVAEEPQQSSIVAATPPSTMDTLSFRATNEVNSVSPVVSPAANERSVLIASARAVPQTLPQTLPAQADASFSIVPGAVSQ